MTIVVAQQFGDRIVIMADTMVTRNGSILRSTKGAEVLPGNLKIVVLSLSLTVAYAGVVDDALKALRHVRSGESLAIDDVIPILVSASRGGDTDFIVSGRTDQGSRLVKIANGRTSEGGDRYWIGNADAVREFERYPKPQAPDKLPDFISAEESRFMSSFDQFLAHIRRELSIGGVPITALTTERRCGYVQRAAAFSFEHMKFDRTGGRFAEDKHPSARDEFAYNFIVPHQDGIGVAGVYLNHAKYGYIYDPLRHNQPVLSTSDLNRFAEEVQLAAGYF